MKGSSKTETEFPWFTSDVVLIDGVQVLGGVRFGVSAREEGDAWHGWWDGSLEGLNGGSRDFFGGSSDWAALAWGDHVGFEWDTKLGSI